MGNTKVSLPDKIREAEDKIKQLEADLYFMQGYLKALLDIQIDEKEATNGTPES